MYRGRSANRITRDNGSRVRANKSTVSSLHNSDWVAPHIHLPPPSYYPIVMAFGVLLFGVLAWKSSRRWVRWGWAGASCLAAINVLLMVQGRTGYVVLAGLAVVVFYMYFGW